MKLWRYGHALDKLVDRYDLQGILGSGGMADVCLAWDEREEQQVAIKILKPADLDQTLIDRFSKEAEKILHWQHPNVLRFYSKLRLQVVDRARGIMIPFIVMEYAEGGDLQKRLTRNRPYPFKLIIPIFEQLCHAVQYAHDQGVIHRDLKPLNILFRRLPNGEEQLALCDFGMAVDISATHQTFAHGGTLCYMAPEQLHGHSQQASDIFALGVILYQLCTGRLAFPRTIADLTEEQPHLMPLPPSVYVPSIPPALDRIIFRAFEEDPEARYPSALHFLRAFKRIVRDLERVSTDHLYPKSPTPDSFYEMPNEDLEMSPSKYSLNSVSVIEAEEKHTGPGVIDLDSQGSHPNHLDSQPTPHTRPTRKSQLSNAQAQSDVDISHSLRSHNQSVDKQDTPVLTSKRRTKSATPEALTDNEGPSQKGGGTRRRKSQKPLDEDEEFLRSSWGPIGKTSFIKRPGRQKRRRRFPLWLLFLFLTFLVLGGSIAFVLTRSGNGPSFLNIGNATIEMTAALVPVEENYIFSSSPSNGQRKLNVRPVSADSTSASISINGTGIVSKPGTNSTGTLVMSNKTSNPRIVTKGTNFSNLNGVVVLTDEDVNIPAASSPDSSSIMSVKAHSRDTGVKSNFGDTDATALKYTDSTGFFHVENFGSFTGGTDEVNYHYVKQSDIDAKVDSSSWAGAQTAATGKLQKHEGEEWVRDPAQGGASCDAAKPEVSGVVGDTGKNVSTVGVTVKVTCKAEAYDTLSMMNVGIDALTQKANQDLGGDYKAHGPPTLISALPSTQSLLGENAGVLQVQLRGEWVYNFDDIHKQAFARKIVGMKREDATRLLQQSTHMENIQIDVDTLPTDASKISFTIHSV